MQEAGIIPRDSVKDNTMSNPSEKRAKQKAAGIARWKKKQAKQKADWGQ